MKKTKPTLLGYVIYAYYNKFRMNNYDALSECERFSDIYLINRFDPAVKMKTNKNISVTYDNYTIVSDVFKTFCESQNYRGIEFITLPNSSGLYWFKINNMLEWDPEDEGVRFLNYSEECKGYEEIIGANPFHLKIREPVPDGFFRSDLCFGGFQNKFPLNIIGIETKRKLKEACIKGIDGSEIFDRYL
jgi:hypothetical protein